MTRRLATLLIGLLLSLLLAWFFHTFHRVERNEYVGHSGEAGYNWFLSAEYFLKHAGIEADTRESLTPTVWMPEPEDTIVGHASSALATLDEQSALLEWVSAGGHLVLLPPRRDSELTENLLGLIGVSFVMLPTADDEPGKEPPPEDPEADTAAAAEVAADAGLADAEATYIFGSEYWPLRLEVENAEVYDTQLSDADGVVAARRTWGNGYITVIAETDVFYHWELRSHDHARFLLDVVDGYLQSGKVWFVLDAEFASLWSLIWQHGKLLVLASLAALLLWLWSVLPRFGPLVGDRVLERRSIMEHIDAAGHFAWQHRGTAALGASSAQALVHDIDRKQPGFSRLSPERQAQHIARLSGVPEQDVLDLLLTGDEPRHREFTRNIQLLQQLRKKL